MVVTEDEGIYEVTLHGENQLTGGKTAMRACYKNVLLIYNNRMRQLVEIQTCLDHTYLLLVKKISVNILWGRNN